MKEFVWINIICFLNLAFGQVGEKMKAKTVYGIECSFWWIAKTSFLPNYNK